MQGQPTPGLDGSQKAGSTDLRTNTEGLLLFAVGAERAEIGPEALRLYYVLDAREYNICARDLGARFNDVY
jgi:hypothetical protein